MYSTVRGATTLAGAGLADLELLLGGQDVEPEDDRHREREDGRGGNQPPGVTPGELGARGLRGGGQHGGGSWRPGWDGSVLRVVTREVGAGEGLGDEPGEDLAIGATAGPR